MALIYNNVETVTTGRLLANDDEDCFRHVELDEIQDRLFE